MILCSIILGIVIIEYALSINWSIDSSITLADEIEKRTSIKHRVMKYSAELKSNDYECNIIASYITSQQNVLFYCLLQHMVIDL